ncbi:MAG: hypothetical protein ABH833_04155 [Parcubacteria group bacterium]
METLQNEQPMEQTISDTAPHKNNVKACLMSLLVLVIIYLILSWIVGIWPFMKSLDTSDWQTYRNEEFGFEIKYPVQNNNKDVYYYGPPINCGNYSHRWNVPSPIHSLLEIRIWTEEDRNYNLSNCDAEEGSLPNVYSSPENMNKALQMPVEGKCSLKVNGYPLDAGKNEVECTIIEIGEKKGIQLPPYQEYYKGTIDIKTYIKMHEGTWMQITESYESPEGEGSGESDIKYFDGSMPTEKIPQWAVREAGIISQTINSIKFTSPSFASVPLTISEIDSAKTVLTDFFDFLNNKQFEKAVAIFEPQFEQGSTILRGPVWEGMKAFAPLEHRDNKAKVLESYCHDLNCFLSVEVLTIRKEDPDLYVLSVQFRKDDGSILEIGPCCGMQVEEDYIPTSEFTFGVKEIDGEWKVVTAPIYIP